VIFGCRRLECCSPIQEKTGIPVVGIYTNPNIASGCFESYRLAGKIIGKEERAEELIEFNEEKFAELAEVTSQIPDSEKPRVHLAFWGSITESPGSYYPVDLAGGINVISSESSVTVSKEQVIAWNPDFILIHAGPSVIGWDPATGLTEAFYMAKLFYPDKFEDLDVEKEGNRILANFYGVDGLYTWMQENCDLYRWE
jgi:iron complex transport system substrate-binding protein